MSFRPYRSRRKVKLGKFKSLLEKNFSDYLSKLGLKFEYEPIKLKYIIPEQQRTYTPDFVKDYLIIETKGRLTYRDMNKMLWVKEANPEYDIRFVFPNDAILDKRKSGRRDGEKGLRNGYRYSDWCKDNGFDFYVGAEPPKKWFN